MSDSKPDSVHGSSKSASGWIFSLLWLLVLGGGMWFAQRWLDDRQASRTPQLTHDEQGQQALTLHADRYGHYEFAGKVNDQTVRFLLDTGATGISFPAAVAEHLQLPRGRTFEVMTANGTARVQETHIEALTIGPFTHHDVRAHITSSMEGSTALLGMEFLRHFDLHQRRGTMTISLP